jgi:molybdate transport system substrate-binding protein
MIRIAAAAAVFALLPQGGSTLLVCAAVSLTEPVQEAAALYRAAGGDAVRFNFAGSNTLARQIVNGAPADVFISADEAQMNVAAAAGAIDAATRVDLLSNRLAVIVRPGGPNVREAAQLLGPEVRRVAIGEPAAVPAGVYARQFLESRGLWQGLQRRLVPLPNVRAVLAAVQNGSVDAGIVDGTDAATAPAITQALVVSGAGAPRIVYPAAVLIQSRRPDAARRFLLFLRSPQAAEVFRRYGFSPRAP